MRKLFSVAITIVVSGLFVLVSLGASVAQPATPDPQPERSHDDRRETRHGLGYHMSANGPDTWSMNVFSEAPVGERLGVGCVAERTGSRWSAPSR